MPWFDDAWKASLPVYEAILASPFVTELIAGTLPRHKFIHYLEQDVLYLREYARVLSLLGARSTDIAVTSMFAQGCLAIKEAELEIHDKFLGSGFHAQDHPDLKASPSCALYTAYLSTTAGLASFEEAAAAVLPCHYIYMRVGQYCIERISKDNPYFPWAQLYAGEMIEKATMGLIDLCNKIARPGIDDKMTTAFLTCSELEFRFWNSAYACEQWHHQPHPRLKGARDKIPVALTIAGSDPSGGAGIQADIKTMSALGVFAQSALTAVVNEDTRAVYGVHAIPEDFVKAQIVSCITDIGVHAIKIGMLHSATLVAAVASVLPGNVPVVIDPVMVATSGGVLLENDAVSSLRSNLLPRATVVTPNVPEAALLLGTTPDDVIADIVSAASRLGKLVKASVYLKGGHISHASGSEAVRDVLYDVSTDSTTPFDAPFVITKNTHGTGCTLSSAIASFLARGLSLKDAVSAAREYTHGAIVSSASISLAKGNGPLVHFYQAL